MKPICFLKHWLKEILISSQTEALQDNSNICGSSTPEQGDKGMPARGWMACSVLVWGLLVQLSPVMFLTKQVVLARLLQRNRRDVFQADKRL